MPLASGVPTVGVPATGLSASGETETVIRLLKKHFGDVKHVKPKASRAQSSEVYLVATGFKGP